MNFGTILWANIDFQPKRRKKENFKIYARRRLAELRDEFMSCLQRIHPRTQPTKELIRLKPQEVVEK
jgi:hypothetical protein